MAQTKFQHPILLNLRKGSKLLLTDGRKAKVKQISDIDDYYPPILVRVKGYTGYVKETVYPCHIKQIVKGTKS